MSDSDYIRLYNMIESVFKTAYYLGSLRSPRASQCEEICRDELAEIIAFLDIKFVDGKITSIAGRKSDD